VNGGEWSDWGSWSPCHDGKKVRKRQCNGGAECPGSSVEEDNCPPDVPCEDNDENCPGWSRRGECEKNPDYMLVNCRQSCKVCKVNGGEWSDWGSWSPCHDGKKVRKRQCNGGAECPGSSVEEDNCPPGEKWKHTQGTAQKISVGQAGVFIIDENNQVREKKGENWDVVKGGEDAADISVGDQTLWVVMKNETIFRWKSSWEKMSGTLTNVCVNGDDDSEVWGVNRYTWVYKLTNGNWIQDWIGRLKQITCGEAGVWGINPRGNLYTYGDGGLFGWTQVQTGGNTFTWISSGLSGEVWAVDENGTVFRSGGGHEWIEVPGQKMRQVDVFNGTVWGVDRNNKIWSRPTTV